MTRGVDESRNGSAMRGQEFIVVFVAVSRAVEGTDVSQFQRVEALTDPP